MKSVLDDLKKLLGIEDDSLDSKLELILKSVQGRLKLLLGGIVVPPEMNHIVLEVAVIRFNRLGSEGMSSHNVEGENMSYNDNDFDGFMNEIQAFLYSHKESKRGRVRFICGGIQKFSFSRSYLGSMTKLLGIMEMI